MKALYIKKFDKSSPYIHNLVRIAKKCGLEFDDELASDLGEISMFNINARYDDYKLKFHEKADLEYTKLYLGKIIKIKKWIEKEI